MLVACVPTHLPHAKLKKLASTHIVAHNFGMYMTTSEHMWHMSDACHELLHILKSSSSWFKAETLHINEYHLKSLFKECGLTKYTKRSLCLQWIRSNIVCRKQSTTLKSN